MLDVLPAVVPVVSHGLISIDSPNTDRKNRLGQEAGSDKADNIKCFAKGTA